MYIIGKYIILFVRALETGRKTSLWWAFLVCFETSACTFYLYRECTYIVFNLQCQNDQNNSQMLLKRTETSIIPIIFKSVISVLHCYRFLLFALNESGTRRLLFIY